MVADTHLAAIADAEGLSLAGVLGRVADKTTAFAHKATALLGHPVTAYADIAAVAADPSVDFAIVATPPDARLEITRSLAVAGKPILMEKPMERTHAGALQLATLCKVRSVPLGVCLQHRVRAASTALKALVDTGALGEIFAVDIRVPWWRDQSYYAVPGRGSYARDGGGVVITQAIHTLDLALWLAGPVASVQALSTTTPLHQLEAEDWAGALLRFENGATGAFLATTAAFPGSAESLALQGTKAHARLEGDLLGVSYLDGRQEHTGAATETGGGADPMAFSHGWHQSIIEDFMRCVQTGGTPLASAASALQTHALIDAIARAAASGQTEKVQKP
ncbi:MAG: Gfo/Idh/MocA family oxidoreductase [Pseudomonadota bacterium]